MEGTLVCMYWTIAILAILESISDQVVNDVGLALIWGRCYDFKNSFAQKTGETIGVFCSNYR
jgi:hypothetical protein